MEAETWEGLGPRSGLATTDQFTPTGRREETDEGFVGARELVRCIARIPFLLSSLADPRAYSSNPKAGMRRFDDLSTAPLRIWITRHAVVLLIAAGCLTRSAEYIHDRYMWMDEYSLAGVIESLKPGDEFRPLHSTQLAPPGYLVIERILAGWFGLGSRVLRFPSFAGAIASVFLFRFVSARLLGPTAALLALAMFVVSDDLIYYADELKQYSTDTAAALFCLSLGLTAASAAPTTRGMLGLAAAGAVVVWFSHPSVFVLASVGTVLLISAARRRDGRTFVATSLVCLSWLASFAIVYLVSNRQLGHRDDMWAFWNFAFPPRTISGIFDATWPLRRFLYFFHNPLGFDTPLGPRVSLIAPVACFAVGAWSLLKREPARGWMTLAPILFTLGASLPRLYPFHGRLVLFLVPLFLIPIAEGAERIGAAFRSPWPRRILFASLLIWPTLLAFEGLETPRGRVQTNNVGDRRSHDVDPMTFPF